MALIRSAIGLIVALALAGLAVMNTDKITFTFSPAHPALELPLYAVFLGALVAGLVIGATFIWFVQGKTRRALRRAKKQIKSLEDQLEETQNRVTSNDPAAELFPAIPKKRRA